MGMAGRFPAAVARGGALLLLLSLAEQAAARNFMYINSLYLSLYSLLPSLPSHFSLLYPSLSYISVVPAVSLLPARAHCILAIARTQLGMAFAC